MSPEGIPGDQLGTLNKSPGTKFNSIRRNLVRFYTFGVTKEETRLFKAKLNKLQNRTTKIPEAEAKRDINELSRSPYYLFGRSVSIQKAFLSWYIKKIDPSASENFRQTLVNRFVGTLSSQGAQETEMKKVLKKYGINDLAMTAGKSADGDPLMDSPIGIPLDESFYKGTNPNDILPLGVRKSKLLPSDFRELLKGADALQIIVFKILSKHVYNPVIKWYNTLEEPFPKNVVDRTIIRPFKAMFKRFITKFTARRLSKNANAASTAVKDFVSEIDTIMNIVGLVSRNKNVPNSVKSFLAKNKIINKDASKKEFENTVGTLLKLTSGVLDIAARDPHAVKKNRIATAPDCFFHNKLFLMVLMQHKKSKGMQKYMTEFFALVVANFKGDNELRLRAKSMRPMIEYLCLNTPMGLKFATMAGLGQTWKSMKTVAEKKKILDTVLKFLWPDKVLTKSEKRTSVNQAYQSLSGIYTQAIGQLVGKTPDKTKRTELLLGVNMLLDNIRTHLVSASGNKPKAKKLIKQLVATVKTLKVNLSPDERKSLTQNNPTLKAILNNPEGIEIALLAVMHGASGAVKSIPYLKNTSVNGGRAAIALIGRCKKLAQKVKDYERKYSSLKIVRKQLESKIRDYVKRKQKAPNSLVSKLTAIKEKIRRVKSMIIGKARIIQQLDARSVGLKNVQKLISNLSNPRVLAAVLPIIQSQLLSRVPEQVRKQAGVDVLKQMIQAASPNNILKRANIITDKIINRSILRQIFKTADGASMLFKLLVLNKVKGKTLSKAELVDLLVKSALLSIKHTSSYKHFEVISGRTSNRITTLRKQNIAKLKRSIAKYV